VEYGELDTFLRLNDTWDESIEEARPTLLTKPIGVPGASSPLQMAKPAHRALFNASPSPSPGASPSSGPRAPGGPTGSSSTTTTTTTSTSSPLRKLGAATTSASSSLVERKAALRKRGEAEFDVSEELSGYGLQGVKVTEDDLLALVQELGLGGDEAGDLVKGLGGDFTDSCKAGDSEANKGGEGEAAANDVPTNGGVDGGAGQSGPQAESEVSEAKPEAAALVAREEAKAAEDNNDIDDAGKAETEVAAVAST